MPNIDWDAVDKADANAPAQYKDYAPKGEYKVKLESVKITDNPGWKSPAMQFNWQEDSNYKYPRSATHWLSIGNPTYRLRHNQALLMAFGFTKEKARELIEAAEKDSDRIKLVKAYEALYKRVAERHPEVTVVVQDQYRNDKPVVVTSSKGTTYTPTETDMTAYGCRVSTPPKADLSDPLAGSETIDMNEIPFDI